MKWAEPACGHRLSLSMHVERSGAPQFVALALVSQAAIVSAMETAATRAGGFRQARIAGELITGVTAWYGAVMALGPPLVLGSASPRRREILERLGLPHVVVAPSADETVLPGEGAEAYLAR